MFLSCGFVRLLIVCDRLSYGTGRPAILTDDESIWQCRLLLRHPLAIDDDTRLVSMVELMAIRERITNHLSPFSHVPVDERTFEIVRGAYADFKHWYQTWDQAFSQKYEDAGMYFTSEYRTPQLTFFFQRSTGKVYKFNSYMLSCTTVLRLLEALTALRMFKRCLHLREKSPSSQFRLLVKVWISRLSRIHIEKG